MVKLAYSTPISKLEKIKVGDEVIDEYQSSGKVVKIEKKIRAELVEFIFLLDSRQTIFIMCSA